ncbi:hypothetical protein [Candidatus Burkholderia verschuerenii]|uniref:hypothetical protein n=1 Tax=Candidatus Burkholderia verschuerenii TaxID=242163 RepID=UPI00067B0CF3|nr:hypothetical protein [Candidatus Burkholderia verschuerenii]
MKKIILAVAALATSGLVLAQTQPVTPAAPAPDAAQQFTQAQLSILHQDLQQVVGELAARAPSQDPFSFCYFKNEAYSLGSVRDGLVCEKTGVHWNTPDGEDRRIASVAIRFAGFRRTRKRVAAIANFPGACAPRCGR